jgi:hypothetical protein
LLLPATSFIEPRSLGTRALRQPAPVASQRARAFSKAKGPL